MAIEDLFIQPAGSLAVTTNVGSATKFSSYLLNLDDIDENSISFDIVAEADSPTYSDLFRVLEVDTFDRYYLTFNEAQNVNLRINSANILAIEIGEGYDLNPGQSFTITLN